MLRPPIITSRKQQRGVGLIEVLIAVLVMAIGILGVTAMQVAGKRNIYEATQRSLATALARDILERMRSNPSALSSYVATVGRGSISTAPASCNTSDCTPTALASRDLYDFEQALDGASETLTVGTDTSSTGGLVSPTACITNNAGNVTVSIAWRGASETSDPDPANTCGAGLYGANDSQRRLLVISTYIEAI